MKVYTKQLKNMVCSDKDYIVTTCLQLIYHNDYVGALRFIDNIYDRFYPLWLNAKDQSETKAQIEYCDIMLSVIKISLNCLDIFFPQLHDCYTKIDDYEFSLFMNELINRISKCVIDNKVPDKP